MDILSSTDWQDVDDVGDQVLVIVVIAGKITIWEPSVGRGCDRRKDHRLRPSVGHGCDRRNDHRGIEDTELLDIRDVVRESWVKIKLLVVI